jgi:hypothetical protein
VKPKHVLIYIVILAGLAAYVFFGEIKRQEIQKAEETKAAKLVQVDRKDISAIEVNSKERGKIDLVKTEDIWMVTSPVKCKADERAVDTYLRTIADASRVRVIKEKDVNWGEFGLSEPDFTVTFKAKEANHKLAFGAFNPAKTSIYLRVDESPQLMLVEDTLKNAFNKTALDLRDKSVLAVANEDVERVVVAEEGKRTEISRGADKKWVMEAPEKIKVKATAMNRQVNALVALQASDIIDQPQKDGDPYGLEKPAITLEIGGPKRQQKLLIGKAKEDKEGAKQPPRYAKVEGRDPVFVIDGSVVKDLQLDPKQLEDRSILELQSNEVEKIEVGLEGKQWLAVKGQDGKWKLEKPEQKSKVENRVISELLWNLKELEWKSVKVAGPNDLKGLDLKEPKLVLTLSLKGKEEPIKLKAGWSLPPVNKPEEAAPDKKADSQPSGDKKDQPKQDPTAGRTEVVQVPPDTLNLMVEPAQEKGKVYVVDGIFLEDLRRSLDGLVKGNE